MVQAKNWQCFGSRCGAFFFLIAVLVGFRAEASVCARPAERTALNERVLQTHLMVAALSCNERARYNNFVKKFQSELGVRGRSMASMFDRAYGRGSSTHINSFVTALANDASARSIASNQFCNDSAVLFETLEIIDPALLSELAENQPFSDVHGITACRQQASTATGK